MKFFSQKQTYKTKTMVEKWNELHFTWRFSNTFQSSYSRSLEPGVKRVLETLRMKSPWQESFLKRHFWRYWSCLFSNHAIAGFELNMKKKISLFKIFLHSHTKSYKIETIFQQIDYVIAGQHSIKLRSRNTLLKV